MQPVKALAVFLSCYCANAAAPTNSAVATFGAGCYWGTEKFFWQFNEEFPGSITKIQVGFMGGHLAKPTYRQVTTGTTGQVEVAQVTFNPAISSYEELVKFFFTFHDPTTENRQGNDIGTQYASVIFYHDNEQKTVAERVTSAVTTLVQHRKIQTAGDRVVTTLREASEFYPAHEEHQDYLHKNPGGYCNHRTRFSWPANWKEEL